MFDLFPLQLTITCQVLAKLNKIWSCLIFIMLYLTWIIVALAQILLFRSNSETSIENLWHHCHYLPVKGTRNDMCICARGSDGPEEIFIQFFQNLNPFSDSKGQLISKWNLLLLIWTKNKTELFFDFCPSLQKDFK